MLVGGRTEPFFCSPMGLPWSSCNKLFANRNCLLLPVLKSAFQFPFAMEWTSLHHPPWSSVSGGSYSLRNGSLILLWTLLFSTFSGSRLTESTDSSIGKRVQDGVRVRLRPPHIHVLAPESESSFFSLVLLRRFWIVGSGTTESQSPPPSGFNPRG